MPLPEFFVFSYGGDAHVEDQLARNFCQRACRVVWQGRRADLGLRVQAQFKRDRDPLTLLPLCHVTRDYTFL
jgi:hypothetical protein